MFTFSRDVFFYMEFTLFVSMFLLVSLIVIPRQILGWWAHRKLARGELFMQYPMQKSAGGVTHFMPDYLEDHAVMHESLRLMCASYEKWTDKYAIVCIIDAADIYPEEGIELAKIAKQYDAHVFMTNARSKRKNLRNGVRWAKDPEAKGKVLEAAVEWAKDRGLLYEFSAFHDSDTVPTTPNDDIVGELLRPFADPKIGGVTTAQRIRNPDTPLLQVLDWLEDSRIGSSMAAGTLFGQVGCLPGRLYMIRSEIIVGWMDQLVEHYWNVPFLKSTFPFVGMRRVQLHAGDDREMTLRVEQLGYHTVMNPRATVVTSMPKRLRQINRIFRRWATSSQWLTFISTKYSWFRKQWFVMYQYYTDLLLTLITVFLVGRWFWLLFFSEREPLMPLFFLIVFSFLGTMLTFGSRQLWHLVRHPRRLMVLPMFVVLVTWWQFIRFQALFTPGRISVWGSRKGADESKGEVWFIPFEEFVCPA